MVRTLTSSFRFSGVVYANYRVVMFHINVIIRLFHILEMDILWEHSFDASRVLVGLILFSW